MMIDVGLNRPAGPRKYAKPQREYFRMDSRDNIIVPRTLEERRTFLGCYYLITTCVRSTSIRLRQLLIDCSLPAFQ